MIVELYRCLFVGLLVIHTTAQFSTNVSEHRCCDSIKVRQGGHWRLDGSILKCRLSAWAAMDITSGESMINHIMGTVALLGITGVKFNHIYIWLEYRSQNLLASNAPQFLYQTDESWQITIITCSGVTWLRYWRKNYRWHILQEYRKCTVPWVCGRLDLHGLWWVMED